MVNVYISGMKKHIKIYLKHFGYGDQDFIPSELSGFRAVDIHHIVYKSQGGKDEIDNLIALTRTEHELAHNETISKDYLIQIVKQRL